MSGPVTAPQTLSARAVGDGAAALRVRRTRPVWVAAVSIAAAVAGLVVSAAGSLGWHRFAVAAMAALVVLYVAEVYHRTQSVAAAAGVASFGAAVVVAVVMTVQNPDWVSFYPTGPPLTAGLVGR